MVEHDFALVPADRKLHEKMSQATNMTQKAEGKAAYVELELYFAAHRNCSTEIAPFRHPNIKRLLELRIQVAQILEILRGFFERLGLFLNLDSKILDRSADSSRRLLVHPQ